MGNMHTILPPNASTLERNIERLTERLELLPPSFEQIWNADTCTVAMLPWLAWAFSVDEWDAAWPEAKKRKAIKDSAFIHKHKGTRAAVERALSLYPYPTTLLEWFEQTPPAAPYTFIVKIHLAINNVDADIYPHLIGFINSAKNLRSHYTIRITSAINNRTFFGGSLVSAQTFSVLPYFDNPNLNNQRFYGGSLSSGLSTPLYQKV